MDPAQEEYVIHGLLERMKQASRAGHNIADMLYKNPLADSRKAQDTVLNRMTSEGLVQQVSEEYGAFHVKLTPTGVRAAGHPGGYQGYLKTSFEAQLAAQQALAAKEEREVLSVKAATDSAQSSRVGLALTAVGIVVSLALALASMVQSHNSDAELEAIKSQIKALQQKTAHIKP